MEKCATPTLSLKAPTRRIVAIDILRGVALLGVFLVNVPRMAAPLYLDFADLGWWPGPLDRAATLFLSFALEGKALVMFSFLFGVGFGLQLDRERVSPFLTGYARRLAVLLLIGLAHGLALWYGDVLALYAVLGFFLLLFARCSPHTLVVWATIFLCAPVAVTAIQTAVQGPPPAAEAGPEEMAAAMGALSEQAVTRYATGSYSDIMRQRWEEWMTLRSFTPYLAPYVFGIFLLGLAAARIRFFRDLDSHLPRLRHAMPWFLCLGLIGNTAYVLLKHQANPFAPSVGTLVMGLSFIVGSVGLAAWLSGLVILLAQRPGWQSRLVPFASVGRMTLTHYLLQSVIATTLFYSYGFGLYGRVGPAASMLLGLVVFGLQMLISRWWLTRYSTGPVEWAWRAVMQPDRRRLRRRPAGAGHEA